MTQEQIDYVKKCIREDIHRFYVWGPWKKVRREVLQMDHGECQRCKAKKIYTKATTVHHVNYVKKHPDMALEIWYEWHGVRKRNLVSLCHDCHEAVHGYRKPEKKETLTPREYSDGRVCADCSGGPLMPMGYAILQERPTNRITVQVDVERDQLDRLIDDVAAVNETVDGIIQKIGKIKEG